jgi:hypothetical protein
MRHINPIHTIPCDCDRSYIGETRRPLEVRIKEHKYNLTQGLLEKSKLAQHAYEEGHKICWNKARVLQIEPNTTCRKYKESAHVLLLDHPISSIYWAQLSRFYLKTEIESNLRNVVFCQYFRQGRDDG